MVHNSTCPSTRVIESLWMLSSKGWYTDVWMWPWKVKCIEGGKTTMFLLLARHWYPKIMLCSFSINEMSTDSCSRACSFKKLPCYALQLWKKRASLFYYKLCMVLGRWVCWSRPGLGGETRRPAGPDSAPARAATRCPGSTLPSIWWLGIVEREQVPSRCWCPIVWVVLRQAKRECVRDAPLPKPRVVATRHPSSIRLDREHPLIHRLAIYRV
jgi:hypothetical protein